MINKKKKALLIMPLLVIPFLTMAFWAMGGGKQSKVQDGKVQGLNLNLPNAKLKDDKAEDKLSFYEKAEKDSLKKEEKLKNDPFYQMNTQKDTGSLSAFGKINTFHSFQFSSSSGSPADYKDPNEEKVFAKLQELQSKLKTSSADNSTKEVTPIQSPSANLNRQDIDRLESMLKNQSGDTGSDPQMKELNQMMDKILDIQHPERVKEKIKEQQQTTTTEEKFLSVNPGSPEASVTVMDTGKRKDARIAGFYGLDNDAEFPGGNAIEACVAEDQTLTSGAVVKLRLLSDIRIAGTYIPKNNLVYGTANLNGERLEIDINSIRTGNSIYPVQLQVYDLDGLPGVFIPGAITRDVAKQSVDNSLQLMELTSLDPSLKAQVAGAGINAAKTLLGRKVKQVKVFVKAGYKLLLKEMKT